MEVEIAMDSCLGSVFVTTILVVAVPSPDNGMIYTAQGIATPCSTNVTKSLYLHMAGHNIIYIAIIT